MKQRLFGVAMALCVLLALIPPGAFAADSDAYAILYEDGELVFQNGSAPKSEKAVSKTYEVDLTAAYNAASAVPWHNERESVRVVTFADAFQPVSVAHWFFECKNLQRIENIGNLKTSDVTDMRFMFHCCESLTALDVSGFDTSKVTNMCAMFQFCGKLTELDVSRFDTSNVTDMNAMFSVCESLTALDVSRFNTSKVTDMGVMFQRCSALTALDVSGFDTSNVTNMSYMFSTCPKLEALDVSRFNTSKVTNMYAMFVSCSALTALDVSKFDTSKVTDMRLMFYQCPKLTALDVSKFDTSKVTSMDAMFYECASLTTLDVSGWDTANATSMNSMFSGCASLKTLDVSGWKTSKVTNMRAMFQSCGSLTTLDVSGFDTSNVTDISWIFNACRNVTALDVSRFNTSNATDIRYMFCYCEGLTDLDVSGFDTSKVTSMMATFNDCKNLTTLDVSSFDTANVTNMRYMFASNPKLETIFVSDKFTVASVSDSGDMFISSASLVGGSGTKYDGAHIDKTYARIDGGASAPGYFTAKDAPLSFAVIFDANGGSVSPSSKEVVNGETYGELPTPTRNGYSFDGWFDATDGGTQVTPETTVNLSANQELFARWTPNSYTVAFNANGGSVSPSGKEVTNGGTYGALPTPIRTGYAFDGWFDATDGGKQVTPETAVSLSANQELFARWTPLRYTVTFNANGGSVSPDSKEVTNGGTYGALPTPTRTDYEFDGWRTAIDGGTQVTSETTVNLSDNQELFARWTLVRAVVTFDANGGSVSPSSKEVTNGGTYGELPAPVRNGYVFDGWYTAVEGGTQVTAVNAVRLSDHQTLYAHWRKDAITYSVEDANGEASAVTDISQVAPGSELTVKVEQEAPSDEFRTASVFCAVYDRSGMMVHLQVWEMDVSDPLNIAMVGRIQIPENVSVGEIRVFVLSENLVPLRAAGILG